jgi:hypothetical protein
MSVEANGAQHEGSWAGIACGERSEAGEREIGLHLATFFAAILKTFC